MQITLNKLSNNKWHNLKDEDKVELLVNFNIVYRECKKSFFFENKLYNYLKTFNTYIIEDISLILDFTDQLKDYYLEEIFNGTEIYIKIY